MTVAGDILRATADIVDGDRDKVHGNKERSFNTIAELWTSYLKAMTYFVDKITAEDVANMMALLKIGRICHGTPVRDHYMDAAGYMAIAGELANTEEKYGEEAVDDGDCCNCHDCLYWNQREREDRS